MSKELCGCTQCGRIDEISESRRCGFCVVHENWFPFDKNDDTAQKEAAKLNKKYRRKREDKEKLEKYKKRLLNALKITAVLLLILSAATAILWFRILPEQEYKEAVQLLKEGSYSEALEQFSGMDYGKSQSNAMLCEAFLDLENNDVSSAFEKLEQIEEADPELSEKLKSSMVSIVSDWKAYGITPESLLLLLKKAELFDTEGLLDTDALSIEAHVMMLNEDALDWYVKDVNGDGAQELAVLLAEQAISVYRMETAANEKVTLGESEKAECLTEFGDRVFETDVSEALLLYQAAYEASAVPEYAAKIGNAYRTRAAEEKAANEYEAALSDAEKAYDFIGDKEVFQFLFDTALQKASTETDKSEGLKEWDAFAKVYAQAMERHGLSEDYRVKTAELHLEYAKALAAEEDLQCVAQFREAYSYGMDILEVLTEETEKLDLSKTRIELRKLAVEISENDVESQRLLNEDLKKSLQEWERLEIEPQDVFGLLGYAKELGIEDIDTIEIYHDAALKIASEEGSISDQRFIDWNEDGVEELLAVTKEGLLKLYILEDTFKQAWNVQTNVKNPVIVLGDKDFLIESEDKNSFASYSYTEGEIKKIMMMDGLVDYKRDNKEITFGKILEGSIVRTMYYEYSLENLSQPPISVGIDWQQAEYPYPETPEEVIQRFFEAKGYQIEEEMELLQAREAYGRLGFDFNVLKDMPEAPYTVETSAYDTEAEVVLQEITYQSGKEEKRIYAAAVYEGTWKAAGFSDSFAPGIDTEGSDIDIPLLSLNWAVTEKIEESGEKHTYRMLVPEASCVQMLWKAGEKEGSRTAFCVSIYDAEKLSEAVTSYELKLSASKQMAPPLFLAAGIYYVEVEAKSSGGCEYQLTMQAQAEEYVEQEENDTVEKANEIEVNQEYMASLFRKSDVDCFAFTLESQGIVDIVLKADDIDSKKSRYELKLYNIATGKLLSESEMLGNVKTASMGKVYLDEGRYMVEISQGKTWSSWDYRLTVQYEEAEEIEKESNDTSETATEISLNTVITGSFGVEGDIDFYRFTMDTDMVIQPKLTFSPLESASKTYILTLSGDGGSLYSVNIGGKESGKVIVPMALKAGTYTAKLENPNFIRQDYNFVIAAKEAELSEAEPNDVLAQATELPPGEKITGVLSTQEDIDWYKITLSEERTVTLAFQFEQTTSSKKAFALQLEQNGKSQWSVNVNGESGGIQQKMQIPPGEYYLRVRAGNWIGTVYTVELK